VLDVGCGNGTYLDELGARGHTGRMVGFDISPGMLTAARERAADAVFAVADIQSLPVPAARFDLALAMHMLYHVPDRALAIGELRRVLHPAGTALVTTNSEAHLRELDEVISAAAGREVEPNRLPFTLENGKAELRATFGVVERHDLRSELRVTDVDSVIRYAASMHTFASGDVPLRALDDVREIVAARIARDGAFRVRTHAGCFVCRP
jgi:ubiquinone/menaquinone biosynthesis C-methylase UbiE